MSCDGRGAFYPPLLLTQSLSDPIPISSSLHPKPAQTFFWHSVMQFELEHSHHVVCTMCYQCDLLHIFFLFLSFSLSFWPLVFLLSFVQFQPLSTEIHHVELQVCKRIELTELWRGKIAKTIDVMRWAAYLLCFGASQNTGRKKSTTILEKRNFLLLLLFFGSLCVIVKFSNWKV